MAEETLLLKVIIDGTQPAQSIEQLEQKTKDLTKVLKQVPAEGTEAFNQLAQNISKNLGISLEQAEQKIREFGNTATKEIQEGNKTIKEFQKTLRQIPATANSINAVTQQVKALEKEIKDLDTSTQEFADKSKELKQLKNRLRELKQEAGLAGKTLSQALRDSALDSANFGKQLRGLGRIIRTAFGFGAIRAGISTLRSTYQELVDTYRDSNEAIRTVDDDLTNLNTTIQDAAVSFIEANQEGISNFINFLTELVPVLKANATFLLRLVGVIALFVARQRIANVLTIAGRVALVAYNAIVKVLSGQIRILTVAQKAFNTASKANQIGLIVTGVTAAIAAFTIFNRLLEGNKNVQIQVDKATSNVTKQFREESKSLNGVFGALKNTNAGSKERKELIDAINIAYPDLLKNQDLLNASEKELEAAYRAASKALAQNIIVQQQKALADEFANKQAELLAKRVVEQNRALKINDELGLQTASTTKQIGIGFQLLINPLGETATKLREGAAAGQEFVKTTNEITKSEKEFKEFQKAFSEISDELAETLSRSFDFESLEDNFSSANKEAIDQAKKANRSILEILNERRQNLEKFIKESIALNRDSSKAQEELAKVTEELARVEREFAEATRFGETELQRLQRTQQELLNSIKESISTGEDYSEQQEELAVTQSELNRINEQFDEIIKGINDSVKDYAQGSLADYDERIKVLQEELQKVNIESERYAQLTNEINSLTQERNRVQELLNVNTAEFANEQAKVNEELLDSEASREATQEALNRIRQVTDATDAGAREIERIQQELNQKLSDIQTARLQKRVSDIDSELLELEAVKNAELDLVENNEALKLAIQKQFEAERNALLLEQNNVQAQLLNSELEKFKETQEQKTQIATEETEKQKEKFEEVLEGATAFTLGVLDLIEQGQTQAFEKQREALTQAESAALQEADNLGASEARKQQIREDFAKKQEALERQQAAKEKSIALGRALIEQSILIIKALQTPPAPNALAAGIAAALAALQIATIAAQKFQLGGLFETQVQLGTNKFAKGAYLKNGAYHSQGGMPILNPYTGQKVAEIEKDEAIINRRSMKSRDILTLSGTPLEIASQLNSYKGYGVPFVRKRFSKGGHFNLAKKMTQRGVKYATGGTFGISNRVMKLQSGAVLAADIAREANARFNNTNETNSLLSAQIEQTTLLIQAIENGFNESKSTAEELEAAAQLIKDENNAS